MGGAPNPSREDRAMSAALSPIAAAIAALDAEKATISKIDASERENRVSVAADEKAVAEANAAWKVKHLEDVLGAPTGITPMARGEIADLSDRIEAKREVGDVLRLQSEHRKSTILPELHSAVYSAAGLPLRAYSDRGQELVRKGFNQVHAGLLLAGAAHHLAYGQLRDPKLPEKSRRSWGEAYGPAGTVFEGLATLDWGQWPFSLRPGWIPGHRVHLLPGAPIVEHTILKQLGLENFA
jgi:hypothetical protein